MSPAAPQSTTGRASAHAGAEPVLLGDIGGTNARFAVLADGALSPVKHFAVADFANLSDAAAAFLSGEPRPIRIDNAVLGVAGPVENGRCEIVNSRWRTVDAEVVRRALEFSSVQLINDFEAIAWALRKLGPADVQNVGRGAQQPGEPMVALGPGTGLGAAALLLRNGGIVIATEAGHTDLAGNSDREDAVVAHMRRKFGRVSVERALSGPGLENLYQAIATLDKVAAPARSAAEITRTALEGSCAVSKAALDTFCGMLGAVAGDLALLFRARGGVYLAGGIVPRLTDYLARSEFRARFEAKGRMRAYLETIPTAVIVHRDPAFVGLASLIESQSASASGRR